MVIIESHAGIFLEDPCKVEFGISDIVGGFFHRESNPISLADDERQRLGIGRRHPDRDRDQDPGGRPVRPGRLPAPLRKRAGIDARRRMKMRRRSFQGRETGRTARR